MSGLRAIAEAAKGDGWHNAGFLAAFIDGDEGPAFDPGDAAHIAAWSPDRALAALDVIEAASAYADFTHGNIRGPRYRARQEARDRLLDSIERWDGPA